MLVNVTSAGSASQIFPWSTLMVKETEGEWRGKS